MWLRLPSAVSVSEPVVWDENGRGPLLGCFIVGWLPLAGLVPGECTPPDLLSVLWQALYSEGALLLTVLLENAISCPTCRGTVEIGIGPDGRFLVYE